LPRKSKLQINMEKHFERVKERIVGGEVVDAAGLFDPIPAEGAGEG